MALFDRLVTSGPTKISLHQFMSAGAELVRTRITKAEMEAMFGIPPADVDWVALVAKINGIATPLDKHLFLHELEQVLILAEGGLRYTTAALAKTRLA